MIIYCCHCQNDIKARLTNGVEIYPHRPDLAELPFWICRCGNFVGCHHKTKNRTRPLGNIPTQEIRQARKEIHGILDPLWKLGFMDRRALYRHISDKLCHQYHTAEIRSIEEARKVYRIIKDLHIEQAQINFVKAGN